MADNGILDAGVGLTGSVLTYLGSGTVGEDMLSRAGDRRMGVIDLWLWGKEIKVYLGGNDCGWRRNGLFTCCLFSELFWLPRYSVIMAD